MNKNREIQNIITSLWRSYPNYPSTFGECPTEGCKNHGRGSGECAECLEKELGGLCNCKETARKYHVKIKQIKQLECELLGFNEE